MILRLDKDFVLEKMKEIGTGLLDEQGRRNMQRMKPALDERDHGIGVAIRACHGRYRNR